MMKKWIKGLLTAVLSTTLVACSSGTSTTTPTEGGSSSTEAVTVTIWHTYTEDQEATLQAAADAFNESQEGITVVLESQAYEDFTSKVMQAVRAQNGPDIIINFASEAANYVADGLVVNFDNYLDADYASTLPQASYDGAHAFSDGGMYIYPLVTSGPIFFYNKTIYDELGLTAPTTWDELVANCEAIKAAYPDKYGFSFDSLPDGMQTLITQAGSGMINAETKSVEFNTPESVEQLQWFADNVQNGNFALSPTGSYFSDDMNSDMLVSYIGSVAGIPYIELPNEEELGLAPIPQGLAQDWAPAWDRGAILFTSTPEREAAAVEFIKFFSGEEWNTAFCLSANYASPYVATQANADYQTYLAENEGLQCLAIDVAGSFPNIPGASTVRTALEQAATEAATGTKTAEQALTDAETTANAELQAN